MSGDTTEVQVKLSADASPMEQALHKITGAWLKVGKVGKAVTHDLQHAIGHSFAGELKTDTAKALGDVGLKFAGVGLAAAAAGWAVSKLAHSFGHLIHEAIESAEAYEKSLVQLTGLVKMSDLVAAGGHHAAKGAEEHGAALDKVAVHGVKAEHAVAKHSAHAKVAAAETHKIAMEAISIHEAFAVGESLIKKFSNTAFELGVSTTEIEKGYTRIRPMLAGMNVTEKQAAEFAEDMAKAAVSTGSSTEKAARFGVMLLRTGKVRGTDPFGLALSAEARIKKTDTDAQKLEKIHAAYKKIGGSAKELTQTSAHQEMRFHKMFVMILKGVGLPVVEKIGSVYATMAQWLHHHEKSIKTFHRYWANLVGMVANVADVAWQVVAALSFALPLLPIILGYSSAIGLSIMVWAAKVYFILALLDSFVQALRVISLLIASMFEPKLYSKLFAALDGLSLKLLKAIQPIVALLKMVPPVKALVGQKYDKFVADYARMVVAPAEERAKLKEGERVTDESERRGALDIDAILAKSRIGGKQAVTIKVDKIEIKQDFRDQDPDRVMIEMTQGFERLAERAVQSMAGGHATTFGPGGA